MKQKRFTDEQIVSILVQAEKGEKTIVVLFAHRTEKVYFTITRRYGAEIDGTTVVEVHAAEIKLN